MTLTITMREKGTGRRVRVTIRPDMTPEEVADEVRKQLGTDEPIVFWIRRHDGTERPIPTPDPTYIYQAVESGAEIVLSVDAFMA